MIVITTIRQSQQGRLGSKVESTLPITRCDDSSANSELPDQTYYATCELNLCSMCLFVMTVWSGLSEKAKTGADTLEALGNVESSYRTTCAHIFLLGKT